MSTIPAQTIGAQSREDTQSRKIVFGALFGAIIFVGALLTLLLTSSDLPSSAIGGSDGKLGGDFTLQSLHGDVSLSDFRGKVVMVYFGFTQCQEVCPLSMAVIQNTLLKMAPQELDQVQVILISFDPERDTLEALDEYGKQYHANIIGVTGSEQQIEDVINDYGAFYRLDGIELTAIETTDLDYAFRHSSRYYIIDQQGELVDAMRHSSTANELLARIRTLI